jgi:hypothetical protein
VKLTTPEKTDLMVVEKVAPHPDGLLIEGTIMGAMPMKAVLSPAELRRGFRFLNARTIMTLIRMMFTGRA